MKNGWTEAIEARDKQIAKLEDREKFNIQELVEKQKYIIELERGIKENAGRTDR